MVDVVLVEDENDEKDMEVDRSENNSNEKHEEETSNGEKGNCKGEDGTSPGVNGAEVDKPKVRRKLTVSLKVFKFLQIFSLWLQSLKESEKALRVKTKELKEKQRLEEKVVLILL